MKEFVQADNAKAVVCFRVQENQEYNERGDPTAVRRPFGGGEEASEDSKPSLHQ